MNVVGWIVFAVICVFTLWLLIDTLIWVIKRIKAKKSQRIENKDVDKSE